MERLLWKTNSFSYSFPLWFISGYRILFPCYTAGPCCLSILCIIASPTPSLSTTSLSHIYFIDTVLFQDKFICVIFWIPHISDIIWYFLSLWFQFSSVAQSCLTLCNPMDCSTPGFPGHHQPEFTQTHVHWVSDAIQPSHPLSSPSPPAFNLSQHQGLFQGVSFLHQVAKVLEFQLQHQSFQWWFRTDFV